MSQMMSVGVRIGCIGAALVAWFWTQKLISQKAPTGNGISDRLHDWTAPIHGWLVANPRAANATLIATSALIDLFGLYLLGAAIFGPTFRPFVALLLVFSLRQLCQGLCTLPVPQGTIWRNPGFPSLLVTYGTSNDFFFSGHTSIAVLGALELAHAGPAWLAIAAAVVAAAEAMTVIILRAHYTMDVFAAIFAAWACEHGAAQLAPTIDAWLGRIG
jgi:hypothetical protein